MHKSRIFFKLSDIFNHPLRNYKRYPDIEVVKNISFDNRFGNYTKLDIYSPKGVTGTKLPVFVNVHGGGYVCGDKKYRSGIAKFVATNGYIAVNINYRLAPKYRYPAPTEDIINALNFLNTELSKPEYNADLSKIIVSGDSAGAYYAAHAIAVIYNKELQQSLNLPSYTGEPIRALATFCAPFNLEKCFKSKTPLGVSTDITNCVFGTKFKGYNYDFPQKDTTNVVNFVNPDWCECYISVADKDSFCGGQIDDMLKALDTHNVIYSSYIGRVAGDGHCTHLLPFKKGTPPCLDSLASFLKSIKNK